MVDRLQCIAQYTRNRTAKAIAAFATGHDGNAIAQLSLGNRGQIDAEAILFAQPCLDCGFGGQAQPFGNDIGINADHFEGR